MSADEERLTFEAFTRGVADERFRASGIGDQRVRLGSRSDVRQSFDDCADRQLDVNKIGLADSVRKIRRLFLNRATIHGAIKRCGVAIPAN
jgi:hypothetical protein